MTVIVISQLGVELAGYVSDDHFLLLMCRVHVPVVLGKVLIAVFTGARELTS